MAKIYSKPSIKRDQTFGEQDLPAVIARSRPQSNGKSQTQRRCTVLLLVKERLFFSSSGYSAAGLSHISRSPFATCSSGHRKTPEAYYRSYIPGVDLSRAPGYDLAVAGGGDVETANNFLKESSRISGHPHKILRGVTPGD